MFGMLICFECRHLVHLVEFLLSAANALPTLSEYLLHGFSFIFVVLLSFFFFSLFDVSCFRYNHCVPWCNESMNININNNIANVSFSSLSLLIGCCASQMLPPCEMAFLNGQGELQTIVG